MRTKASSKGPKATLNMSPRIGTSKKLSQQVITDLFLGERSQVIETKKTKHLDSKSKSKHEMMASDSITRKKKPPANVPTLKHNQLGKSGSPRTTKIHNTEQVQELRDDS